MNVIARFSVICFSIAIALPVQAQDELRCAALDTAAGVPAMYKLTFSPRQPLPSDATLDISFPAHFDVSTAKLAGSNDINGGIELTLRDRVVVLKRSGLGTPIPAGKSVSLIFGPIRATGGLSAADSIRVVFRPDRTQEMTVTQKITFEAALE